MSEYWVSVPCAGGPIRKVRARSAESAVIVADLLPRTKAVALKTTREDRLWSPDELGCLWGIDGRTVRRWVQRGEIEAARLAGDSGRVVISTTQAARYLERRVAELEAMAKALLRYGSG